MPFFILSTTYSLSSADSTEVASDLINRKARKAENSEIHIENTTEIINIESFPFSSPFES